MSLITIPFVFSAGNTIIASQHNSNFNTIANVLNGGLDNTNLTGTAGITYANLLLGGNIVNADINSSAAIATSKVNFGANHQGDVFVDNGSGIIRLTPGTNGQFLQTQGAAANVQWASLSAHGSQLFLSSGTFVAPTGVTIVYITMVGAGGSGGGAGSSSGGGGGGGGGEQFINRPYVVVAGNSYTITINAGGSGVSVTNNVGGNSGGTTVFDTLTATGGTGGSTTATGGGGGGIGAITNSNSISVSDQRAGNSSIQGGNGCKGTAAGGPGGGGGGTIGGYGGTGGNAGAGGADALANSGGGGGGMGNGATGHAGSGGTGFVLVLW